MSDTNNQAPRALAAAPSTALAKPARKHAEYDRTHYGSGTDFDYMHDMQQAMVNDRQGASGMLLVLILAMFTSVAAWASVSKVEEITKGEARIIASSRDQVIQSLEGGILSEMLVREGDTVEAGQPLLRIDETRARASYAEGQSKSIALRATAARLRAESRGTPLVFPEDVLGDQELLANETATYEARKQSIDEATRTADSSRRLIQREIAITEPMVNKGLVAETELLRLRRQLNEVVAQTQERVNKFRAEAANQLGQVESELAQTEDSLTARKDTVRRTVISAPLRGIVKNIRVTTRGGVISPAQDIMEIVPLEDKLLVEAKIRPHDVAFLHPGLPATVKISAYDYSIYGGLHGTVDLISPDTLRDEQRQRPGDDTYYRVLVRTNESTLHAGGHDLPIIPGMTATVEIRTGDKTVSEYILKPVMKVREAFRER